MKRKAPDPQDIPNITLPWLIIGIASMVMFMVFLIAMFANFHTAVFFCIWMWIIAAALIYDGVTRRKAKRKLIGNLSLIMGVIAFIAGVWILNL